jgi:hypothetical protein
MILDSRRKSNNEIHTYLLPFPTWDRKVVEAVQLSCA